MYRQIWLLGAIRAIRMFMITMPIIALYWQSHGLLIKDIFILQVIFSIAVIVFEIPSGYLADRFGHKTSLIWGSTTGALGFFILWAVPSYAGFIAAELILAVSAGFMSGARDALLFDTLEAHDQTSTYTKWQGRLMSIGNFSEAVAAVAAGVIASISSISTVLLVQWVIMLFAIPLSFFLTEVRVRIAGQTPTLLKIIRGSIKENPQLRNLNLFAGFLGASTLTMVWFTQPHWNQLGIDVLYFGYIWAGLNVVVGIGSAIAHHLEAWLRFRTLFGLIACGPLLLYAAMALGANSVWVLLVLPFFWLQRGISNPIIQDYVQREAAPEERATVLSINALATRLVFSIFSPFLGWIADIWNLQTAFTASALIFGVCTLIAFAVWYRSRVT